jgi:hypothetical protein
MAMLLRRRSALRQDLADAPRRFVAQLGADAIGAEVARCSKT